LLACGRPSSREAAHNEATTALLVTIDFKIADSFGGV
jgi:hypothetical protein